MPSHLLRYAHQHPGGLIGLVDIGTAFWLAIYVLAIVGGLRNRTYYIPFVAICSNLSWEIIAAFYRPAPNHVWHIGDILWLCLDLVIVWTLLRYGRERQQIPEVERGFYPILAVTFLFTTAAQATLETALHDEWGFLDAYLITTVMSVLFLFMYFARRTHDNFTYAIAWCKLMGNSLISAGLLVLFPQLGGPDTGMPMLATLCFSAFVLDVGYVGLLARARRPSASSVDIASSSRVASAA